MKSFFRPPRKPAEIVECVSDVVERFGFQIEFRRQQARSQVFVKAASGVQPQDTQRHVFESLISPNRRPTAQSSARPVPLPFADERR